MPASDAQILANRKNAARSTGPSTPEGKEVSRANALKHGLTATKVYPEHEAAEVERRTAVYFDELKPSGELGQALVRQAARMSVRMDRCATHENACSTERVRRARAEFVAPEGVTDPAEIARLRQAVERRALFDPSKEASLARKYEAAAERGFFRALKELRLLEGQAKAAEAEALEEKLGSILPGEMTHEEFDALYAREMSTPPRGPASPAGSVDLSAMRGRVDVPIAIGKRR